MPKFEKSGLKHETEIGPKLLWEHYQDLKQRLSEVMKEFAGKSRTRERVQEERGVSEWITHEEVDLMMQGNAKRLLKL